MSLQATSDKLARLESELAQKTDELASQRRALESSWQENSENKRVVAELRAERDDLKRQIGEGTSRVLETEHTKKDIEQRELTLRQTSKQLQESLQRQMNEANAREERLQQEG
jgi:predicted  nucleic acid-binding Zn-ribbon protein